MAKKRRIRTRSTSTLVQKENKPYDKIIRENIEPLIDTLMRRCFGFEYLSKQSKPPRVARTLDREPDFVYIVNQTNDLLCILHIEFQAADDGDMLSRMYEYSGLLYRQYRLPFHQFVIYLGEDEPVKMQTEMRFADIAYKYRLIKIASVPYTDFINSETPEEVILSILCDLQGEDIRLIIQKIMRILQKFSRSRKALEKYFDQLRLLSQLRNKEQIVEEEEKKMLSTLSISLDRDPLFKQGKEQGIRKEKRISAVNSITANLDDKTIEIITCLSTKEITKLRNLYAKHGDKLKSMISDNQI